VAVGEGNGSYLLAKKLGIYAGTFIAVASMLGMINKWFIAEPITRAITEERVARQFADSVIITRINNLSRGQGEIADTQDDILAQRAYSRSQVDAMRRSADRERWRLEARIDSLMRGQRRRR
jgi:hypothetical protein